MDKARTMDEWLAVLKDAEGQWSASTRDKRQVCARLSYWIRTKLRGQVQNDVPWTVAIQKRNELADAFVALWHQTQDQREGKP